MRQRLAYVAASVGAVGALAPLRVLGEDEVWTYGDESMTVAAFVTIGVLAMGVPSAVAVAFGYGVLSQRWAVAAVVAFCAATIFAGWGVFYLGYIAALVLGMAMAAGEPLPPPDPSDDRLSRPMPRADDLR